MVNNFKSDDDDMHLIIWTSDDHHLSYVHKNDNDVSYGFDNMNIIWSSSIIRM